MFDNHWCQVSAVVNDSQNISARASLFSGAATGEVELQDNQEHDTYAVEGHRSCQGGRSFIDTATLKQLRRELDQEVIDSEFNPKVCENLHDMHTYMGQFPTDGLKKKTCYASKLLKRRLKGQENIKRMTYVQLLATLLFVSSYRLGLTGFIQACQSYYWVRATVRW